MYRPLNKDTHPPCGKPPRLLKPKTNAKPARKTLDIALRDLKDWREHVRNHQKIAGPDSMPKMQPYEKARGLPANYIVRLLDKAARLEKMPAEALNRVNVRMRSFYPVEALLVKMIDEIRNRHIPIDQGFLRIMAQEVYTLLQTSVGPLNFARPKFSVGWVESFRKYWGVKYTKLMGEAASVEWSAIVGRVEAIKGILSKYPLDDIYNADETGLFLQTLSNWTLAREKSAGNKAATKRVSILFCANATGTDKRRPLILNGYHNDLELKANVEVYSLLYERSLKAKGKGKATGTDLGGMDVQAPSQGTASKDTISGYMTHKVFLEWLIRFQRSIISKNPSRRVALLLDNARCHTKIIEDAHLFPNIELVFLPPNSTSVTQPLDAGIMAVFKLRYRQLIADETFKIRINEKSLAQRPRAGSYKEIWKMKVPNVQAWRTIVQAWGYVKSDSIKNCFRHVPILNDWQRELLSRTNAIDSSVLEAILSHRDIDELIDEQEWNNEDAPNSTGGTLNVRCQYPASPPVGLGTLEEQHAGAMAWFDFVKEAGAAEDAVMAFRQEDTNTMTTNLGENTSAVSTLPELTDFQRDRATSLASVLDGASFLCEIIDDLKGDMEFMCHFQQGTKNTVLLSGDLLPSDDEDDLDYCTDTESNLSTNTYLDDSDGNQENLDEMDPGDIHDVLMRAAQVLPAQYRGLKKQLERIADSQLGSDYFDANAHYMSLFKKEQDKREEEHRWSFMHDLKFRKRYPGLNLSVTTAGTVVCAAEEIEDIEMSCSRP